MEVVAAIQKMNELSLKKLNIVKEILLFTHSEKDAITAGRWEELEHLVNEKQTRMNVVDRLDEQFLAYSEGLKSSLSLSSLEDLSKHKLPGVKELKEVVSQIHQVIGEIMSLEDENIALVKAELKDTNVKIKQAEGFKRVRAAYNPVNTNTPSYFFDTKK